MARALRKTIELPPIADVAAELARAIRRDGAAAKSAVSKAAGSSARSLALFDALTADGLEIGAKFVRVPLEAQLEAVVGRDGPLPLRGLERRVCGATPREAADAAASLVERGRLRQVVRKADVFLVASTSPVLDARALERVAAAVKELTATLRTASKKRASLLQDDLDALLRPLLPSRAAATAAPVGDVDGHVRKHSEASGLTSVPKLIRALGGPAAREAVHAELLRGARAGRFELRPESGMGRLSAEDLALCIPGPQGTHLSWVRRLEES